MDGLSCQNGDVENEANIPGLVASFGPSHLLTKVMRLLPSHLFGASLDRNPSGSSVLFPSTDCYGDTVIDNRGSKHVIPPKSMASSA